MKADFSGYATKANLKCTDGRTILPDAFKHQDKVTVPLVWNHRVDTPDNILGHAILEHRSDGMYCQAFFNKNERSKDALELVHHGDIKWLSIHANQLIEKAGQVLHGYIKEVSLVPAGANSGALIDNVAVRHGDGDIEVYDDEAIIYTGLEISHSVSSTTSSEDNKKVKAESSEKDPSNEPDSENSEDNVLDIYNAMTDEQKKVLDYFVGKALEVKAELSQSDTSDDNAEPESNDDSSSTETSDSDDSNDEEKTLNHQEGEEMGRRVFDQNRDDKKEGATLSHSDLEKIQADALKIGSYKEAFLAHAQAYGITDIDILFPDAQSVTTQPDLIARRTEWVKSVIDDSKHTPMSRIKSVHADITAEEARARGYVKGNLKKDEIVKLLKRVTTPTTVYKKQKLDRDDIVDITGFDVVAWLKWEMRFMLEEELARAILIGDGREPDDDDKIDEEKLRPIAFDDDMYAHKVTIPSNATPGEIVEYVLRSRKHYRGTGTPTLYTTDDVLTDMILEKDKMGRRLYATETELAAALRVSNIVVVEVMEDEPDILGIIVNISDYTVGADKGGALSMFDDFDIDFNQQKYLMEVRTSGALTKAKSAVVIRRVSGTTVTPLAPTFDSETNTIAFPSTVGVEYFVNDTKVTESTLVISETTDVEARAAVGYSFPHNTDADWTFAYTGA